ncbi:MAG: folate-binding protein YgfZ [Halocynthiibacter sp.]
MPDRSLIDITGADRMHFLQGLVTNDLHRLSDGLVYGALLTPQGKYLADFLLLGRKDRIVVDVKSTLCEELLHRLRLYRLRADVDFAPSDLQVRRGVGRAPEGALADPRHQALGWRQYSENPASDGAVDWDAIRVAHCIPETGIELTPDSYILECGFERLNGVDFRKGCYVGQEVTARMKHKAELKKGLVRVRLSGSAPVGNQITASGKPVGTLFTQSGDHAIAYLRIGRASGEMQSANATITLADSLFGP